MKPKPNRVSIFALVRHELHCAMRRQAAKSVEPLELLSKIASARNRFEKKAATYGGILLVTAIAMSNLSDGQGVDLRINGVGLVIPNVYMAFAGASALFGVLYFALQIVALLFAQSQIAVCFKDAGRFIETELGLTESGQFDFTSPIRVGHFVRLNKPFMTIATTIYLLPVLAGLLPATVAGFFILKESLAGLDGTSTAFAARTVSAASLVLIMCPILYCVLFFIPTLSFKDIEHIRWNFLTRLTKKESRAHPNASKWLEHLDKR